MDSTNKEDKDRIDSLINLVNRALMGKADQRQVLRQTHLRLQAIKPTLEWLRDEREKLLDQLNREKK
tara:strand:- start:631 stop:831 length:201 start_codon:yes stop_codon:yes gene_type:complete